MMNLQIFMTNIMKGIKNFVMHQYKLIQKVSIVIRESLLEDKKYMNIYHQREIK